MLIISISGERFLFRGNGVRGSYCFSIGAILTKAMFLWELWNLTAMGGEYGIGEMDGDNVSRKGGFLR